MKSIVRSCFLVCASVLVFGILSCSSDGESHTHTFSSEWSSNELTHWHVATCGHTDQIKNLGPHVFPEKWVVISAATEETTGE